MKRIDEYQETLNASVYAKIRKDLLADGVLDESFIRCSKCKPHKGENANYKKRNGRKARKDWKNSDRRI